MDIVGAGSEPAPTIPTIATGMVALRPAPTIQQLQQGWWPIRPAPTIHTIRGIGAKASWLPYP